MAASQAKMHSGDAGDVGAAAMARVGEFPRRSSGDGARIGNSMERELLQCRRHGQGWPEVAGRQSPVLGKKVATVVMGYSGTKAESR